MSADAVGRSACATGACQFFMKFRRPEAHPNRPQKSMVCPTLLRPVFDLANRPGRVVTGKTQRRGEIHLAVPQSDRAARSLYAHDLSLVNPSCNLARRHLQTKPIPAPLLELKVTARLVVDQNSVWYR